MPIQATMTIGDKATAAVASVLSAAATFPAANQVRIVSIPAAADFHRTGDAQRAIKACLDYARDLGRFNSATSFAIVTSLDGQKNAIREETLAANVVTGDIGIMVVGSVRNEGYTNIVDNAHKQLIDYVRELDRLMA